MTGVGVVALVLLVVLIPLAMIVGGMALFNSGHRSIKSAKADHKAYSMQRDFYKANPGATQQDFIQFYIAQRAAQRGSVGSSASRGSQGLSPEVSPNVQLAREMGSSNDQTLQIQSNNAVGARSRELAEWTPTSTDVKIQALSYAITHTAYEEFAEDWVLSCDLAVAVGEGAAILTPKGVEWISEGFEAFCEHLDIDPQGSYSSLDEMKRRATR